MTHEEYIRRVASLAVHVSKTLTDQDKASIVGIKLVYGSGVNTHARGVTYHEAWQNEDGTHQPFVELCAVYEENWLQLACTTIHELGHVIAGYEAGHSQAWKQACSRLGLRRARAVSPRYYLAQLDQPLRMAIADLPKPTDGRPMSATPLLPKDWTCRPCGAGVGVRGGRSRGVGSGSRLRRFTCECPTPLIIRVARDSVNCTCNECSSLFKREE